MSLFFWAGPQRPSGWMPSTAHMQHPIPGPSPVCALLDRRPLLMEPRSYRTPTASTTSPPSLLFSPHVNIGLDPPSPCFFFCQGIISHLSPLRLPLCFSIFSELFFQVEHTINFPIALCCQVYISPLDSAAHITGFDATAPKPFSASPTPESLDEPPLPYACPAGSTNLTDARPGDLAPREPPSRPHWLRHPISARRGDRARSRVTAAGSPSCRGTSQQATARIWAD
jgi:hypothetical protein